MRFRFYKITLLVSLVLSGLTCQQQHDASLKAKLLTSKSADSLQAFPPFRVELRIPKLEKGGYYPCTDCHDGEEEPVPLVRKLTDEHEDIALKHGNGKFWCLTCHNTNQRDWLVDQLQNKISFNDVSRLCGTCHFRQELDFTHGAHGKRVGNWNGERVLMPCTSCHNPHDPSIKARKPSPPPKTRKGLPVGSDEE